MGFCLVCSNQIPDIWLGDHLRWRHNVTIEDWPVLDYTDDLLPPVTLDHTVTAMTPEQAKTNHPSRTGSPAASLTAIQRAQQDEARRRRQTGDQVSDFDMTDSPSTNPASGGSSDSSSGSSGDSGSSSSSSSSDSGGGGGCD